MRELVRTGRRRPSGFEAASAWTARFVLVAALAVLPARGQIGTATLEVEVRATDGSALPGAVVSVASDDTGWERGALSASDGLCRFVALPVGDYRVAVSLDGFAGPDPQTLTLRVGQTGRARFSLSPSLSETVTVTAATPLVDIYRTESSSNVVPEQIEDLPVADRDFQRLAFIAPGVQRERGSFRFIQGGPVIGAGGNASQATILVDGADFTDPSLGLARARFGQDAIQEFRVIQNRFDSEIGGSAGGALSIVTKTGTNDTRGSVFSFFRADSLRSTGALETDEVDFDRFQGGFTLGGPIVEDHTHYFVSLERIEEDNLALFRPGGAFVDTAEDVDHPFEQTLGLFNITHRIDERQNLRARFVYEDYEEENFRVGGVNDVSTGQTLKRKNWNAAFEHTYLFDCGALNELRVQIGHREFDEPTNSDAVSEWFSSGVTLQTGQNILGDLLGEGDVVELRDTFHWTARGHGLHRLKAGLSLQYVEERSRIDTFQAGLLVYLTDDRSLPLSYLFGIGSSDVTTDTTLWGAFIQDDWQVTPELTLGLGLRYDLDTDGNNPDFTHPLVPEGRDRDDDNLQPRFSFLYDIGARGRNVVRGGAGVFTGRYLLIPATIELQQNGLTGRRVQTRLNGALFGLPDFALDVNDPENTGLPLASDISLMDSELNAPHSTQLSLGWTRRLGNTGLFLDAEAVYVRGDDEILIRDTNFGGNELPVRLDPAYNQINTYTNEGRSLYKAFIVGLNGTLADRHLITFNVTYGEKKNIADDFSPQFPFGYPNDPSRIDSEWGRSRGDERVRIVASGVFQLPYGIKLAPIFEYGSGQPWNHRLGYDFNGDGKNSDRPLGVARNDEDGPEFRQVSLRATKSFALGDHRLDLIVEAFNLFDTTNFDVSSVDAAEFLSGPTLASPTLPYVPNPGFGDFRATLAPLEIQVGLRYAF